MTIDQSIRDRIHHFSPAEVHAIGLRAQPQVVGPRNTPLTSATIGDMLASVALRQPDADAVVSLHQGIRLSYGELAREVEAIALGLLRLGIRKGERVGIWSQNCVEWTVAQLATARVGAILVNVNPAYRSNELRFALRHSGVRLLFTAIAFKVSNYLSMIAGVGNLGCLSAGAAMVYPSAVFDAVATLQAIQDERCTSVYGVPTMFITQLEHPRFAEFDLRSLRTGLMGGAPCPVETMNQVVSRMHAREICIAYGMTETAPVTFMTRPDDDLLRRVSTVGRVMPHIEAKIVDAETGLPQPTGVPGEVCTRGYALMPGYWENPEATSAAIDEDGWMHTGDLGTLDAEGYLNIVGRIKDMVIRGGENLSPREIEEVLFEHPAIAAAQVVGVPDARMGEELMAWIIAREGMQIDEDEVRAFCRARLAHFKVPRYVRVASSFPLTVTGKVPKFRLRESAIEELGLIEVRTA